jgi:hypothetical protein
MASAFVDYYFEKAQRETKKAERKAARLDAKEQRKLAKLADVKSDDSNETHKHVCRCP